MEIFTSQEFKKIFKFRPWRGALFDIDKNATILTKLIPHGDLSNTKIPMLVSVVDLYSGKEMIFHEGNLHALCLGSSALVPIFPKVQYQDMLLVDGGVINHMPITPLRDFDLPIVGVNLHPRGDLSSDYSWWQMIKRVHFLNTFSSGLSNEQECHIVISSSEIRQFSIFSMKHLESLFEMGYKETLKKFS